MEEIEESIDKEYKIGFSILSHDDEKIFQLKYLKDHEANKSLIHVTIVTSETAFELMQSLAGWCCVSLAKARFVHYLNHPSFDQKVHEGPYDDITVGLCTSKKDLKLREVIDTIKLMYTVK